jgi:cytochrome d ubiquinol oxidase subunit I
MSAETLHRLHFAFSVTFHYLFPQLSMGLGLLIVILKLRAVVTKDAAWDRAVRFWSRLFGITFVMGVVTGIPLEFQFGTNWARFSHAAGGVIGQTLAMEGVFAFFLESSFLYALLFGEKRLGPKGHLLAAILVCTGSWLSGYFIVCTNAWMQHPVGYRVDADGVIHLSSWSALMLNPWAFVQYAHTMVGSVITASFTMAAVSSFYLLRNLHLDVFGRCLRVAVTVGVVASIMAALPTGDLHIKKVAEHQPITFAAMEGHFHTHRGVGITLVGQPNMETLTLDNPIVVPEALSFLLHQRPGTEIKGLVDFPRSEWPDNVPLLYYSYHIMAGLGTLFIALMSLSAVLSWRGELLRVRGVLWALMLFAPLPYVANTAGWLTAELGRQPWLIHGLMRTRDGYSANVSPGNALFSLLGFMGLYALLALLYFFLVTKLLARGPEPVSEHEGTEATSAHAGSAGQGS